MNRRDAGSAWERHAERWLCRQGLRLLQRNFHCRLGEIDLVMSHAGCTVFVEVRYRGPSSRGRGLESVTREKQLKLARAAGIFLNAHPRLAAGPCRFDVVALDGEGSRPRIRWVRNAFESALA